MEYLDVMRQVADIVSLLIIPIFVMMLNVQGRISRMEGEVKALYKVIELISKKEA